MYASSKVAKPKQPDPLSSTLALRFTLDVDTTGSQAKTRFRFCGSVDRLLTHSSGEREFVFVS